MHVWDIPSRWPEGHGQGGLARRRCGHRISTQCWNPQRVPRWRKLPGACRVSHLVQRPTSVFAPPSFFSARFSLLYQALFEDRKKGTQRGLTQGFSSETQYPENKNHNAHSEQIKKETKRTKKKSKGVLAWEITFSSERMKSSWKMTGQSSFVTYKNALWL